MKPNIQIKKYKFKNFTSLTKSEAKKVYIKHGSRRKPNQKRNQG